MAEWYLLKCVLNYDWPRMQCHHLPLHVRVLRVARPVRFMRGEAWSGGVWGPLLQRE